MNGTLLLCWPLDLLKYSTMTQLLLHFYHAPRERFQSLPQEEDKDALNARQVYFKFLGSVF